MYDRGGILYTNIKNIHGKWVKVSTGFPVGQEEQAEAWVRQQEREIDRERKKLAGQPPDTDLTVEQWIDRWVETRSALGLDSNHDAGRLTKHIASRIGDVLVRDVTPATLVNVFEQIRTTKVPRRAGGEPELPAARTVYNIYSATQALFRDARLKGIIAQTPCILTDQQLGPKVDKDREWRQDAVFTRDEAQALISSSKIPLDRRVAYAIELLCGLRPGENAALRWRHYEPEIEPLGSLLVATALDSDKHELKGTKTESVKYVPVHPTLATILAEWKLSGWPAIFGKQPTPDDLIVPIPPDDARRRRSRYGKEAFRTNYYAHRRWNDVDLQALGWRDRRHYDMRATFVTLALEDGADEDILERYVTHAKKRRSAFDGYNRGKQWAKVCTEVAKLRISRAEKSSLVSVLSHQSGTVTKSAT